MLADSSGVISHEPVSDRLPTGYPGMGDFSSRETPFYQGNVKGLYLK